MSDPLSVTASIIAVLSLTAKVNDYLINVKISSEEHSRCANEAGHLYSLLSSLRFRVEGATASEPWFVSARALAVENGPLDQFKMDLELLQRTLTDGGKIRKALMWKFDKEEIDRVLGRMERLKALIGMSLETDHFKLSQAIKEEMSNLKDNTGLIKGDTGLIKGDTGLIKDDTGSIRTYLPVLDSIQKDQQANQEREKLDELLTWLSTTEFPAQLEDILMRRHEGTCQWLLEAPEFQKWLVESKQTLFCPGIPGAGKTVAAAIAIDHCLKREALAKDGSIGVAYMFCNYNAQNEQQTVDLLAAILKQLTCSKPSVAEHAKTLRKKCAVSHRKASTVSHRKASTVSHRKASTGDILDTLSAILQSYTTVYVVVDALDECSDAVRSTLPAKLQALQSKHDFRILITSRFNSDILDTFNDALSLEVRANTEDVKLCIASQIEKLPRCIQRDPELALLVSEKIAKATDGMFLLAQLYLDSLLDKRTKNKVHAALANLSTGSEAINEAYDEAIRRIKSQLPEDAALAHRILTWLVYARQNLTTAELLDALAVKPGTSKIDPDDLEDIKSVISVCAGLVAVDEKSNIVRLVHYTTQEYFEGIKNEWNPNAQLEITTACLAYLSFEAFREGACNTEEDWCTRKYDHSFLEYAGRFWGEHAISVQHEVTEMVLLLLQHDGITSSIMQAFDKAGKQFWKDLTYLAPKRQITAIHLGALFGLDHIVEQVLYRSEQDPKLAVNTKDSDNLTPLHFAVDGNNLDMVRILHRHGVDLDARGRFEATAVSIAIENGYVQMVDLLLRLGADYKMTRWGRVKTAFHCAAEKGHAEIMQMLFDHEPTMIFRNKFTMPIHIAAKGGCLDVLKVLLEKGVDIEAEDENGHRALHFASEYGRENIVQLLLENGADITTSDEDGMSLLHLASSRGNENVVKILLANGVTTTALNDEGLTPLDLAVEEKELGVIKVLLKAGADLTPTQVCRYTLDDYSADILEVLIEHVSDINAIPDHYYDTLLHRIAFEGSTSLLKLAVKSYKANLHVQDYYYRSLLHIAALGRHRETVLYLVEHGLNPLQRDDMGKDTLCYAALGCSLEVVTAVLDKQWMSSTYDNT